MSSTKAPVKPLLLTSREAAKALSISERTLWRRTKAGEIKPTKLGKCLRYSVRELEAYVDRLSES